MNDCTDENFPDKTEYEYTESKVRVYPADLPFDHHRMLVRMVLCFTFISRWYLAVMAIVVHPSFLVPLNGSFFPSVSGGAA
jgi:hypothetical protein